MVAKHSHQILLGRTFPNPSLGYYRILCPRLRHQWYQLDLHCQKVKPHHTRCQDRRNSFQYLQNGHSVNLTLFLAIRLTSCRLFLLPCQCRLRILSVQPHQGKQPRTSSSTTLPDSLTPTQAASRTDLTTIAIHPWPVEFETDSPTSEIAKIRSQYGKSTECDKVLVAFSKKLSIILRHDTSQHNDPWITCVDKSRWPHGIVWPVYDLCQYLGKIINYTMHFGSGEFRDVFLRCMPDCEEHLKKNLRYCDWDCVGIPSLFAFKWLAICAFDRPRIAKLCSTKCETFYKDN